VKTALSKFFAWIGKAQSEDNGHPSTMRMNIFNLAFQWVLVISFVMIWSCIWYPQYILALVPMLIGGIMAALGIKGWQKGKEENVVTPPEVKP
jgi:high-affinity K+ transport system ATPase subunit B